MGFGATLKRLREYYTHKEVDKRISDAQESLQHTKIDTERVRKSVIAPANYFSGQNGYARIIIDSLVKGYGGENNK